MPYAHSDKTEAAPSNPAPGLRAREKLEGGRRFVMQTEFQPAGDQPEAIAELSAGILAGERNQVLLGATGTTTMEHSACAMQTHPAVSAAARSAPGAERKRCWRTACAEVRGRLS